MASTVNYGLHLTDDSSTKFLDWRNQINGPDDSNMVKIDNALKSTEDKIENTKDAFQSSIDDVNNELKTKAKASVYVEATLLSSEWEGSASPFVQTIAIDNITKDSNGTVSLSNNATIEQISAVKASRLTPSDQGDRYITISAEEKPTIDISIVVIILG